ncbi:hypothetical protein EMIHUDRAFT_232003 [Emiliania huxleyi CCMP1516]|uniref:RING-type domain-containing protein n=2 Tax=Emiliania huxleyi TaxID=2903 RepID=A0A0D3K6L4_EMIH1|nr:hypothetical protein EMIHUDRAFT_232003 [Emiliania huxleyi CCMP1516]EOD31399.1 hypothetical protein EMIHUDRAFT_232003 [Emiliania huxleyi CCMP1516]|eukprot:XP_005783828.1 hypothetical protein EMIHUDRAFT_232003 [Emiliania huxleyi CCMP1516]
MTTNEFFQLTDDGGKARAVCEKPLSQLAVEGGTRVVWLETCSHWACVDCHIQWVQARDSQGLEPTCLTASCNSALTDAAIREMLGDAAHQARDEQLLSRAAAGGGERNWPCPTPNCPYRVAYRVALEEGSAPRPTTCPRCLKVFVVGAPSLPAAAEAADDDDGCQQRKRRREEEMASVAALQQYQKCKSCGQGVEKDPATCDLFQCRCGLRWCWKCGTEADERGKPACNCTGRGHVFWDNQAGRPAGEAFARKRPQSGRRRRPS